MQDPVLCLGRPPLRVAVGSMTIILKPEQEQVLIDAINSGLAHTTDEAQSRPGRPAGPFASVAITCPLL